MRVLAFASAPTSGRKPVEEAATRKWFSLFINDDDSIIFAKYLLMFREYRVEAETAPAEGIYIATLLHVFFILLHTFFYGMDFLVVNLVPKLGDFCVIRGMTSNRALVIFIAILDPLCTSAAHYPSLQTMYM